MTENRVSLSAELESSLYIVPRLARLIQGYNIDQPSFFSFLPSQFPELGLKTVNGVGRDVIDYSSVDAVEFLVLERPVACSESDALANNSTGTVVLCQSQSSEVKCKYQSSERRQSFAFDLTTF